MTEIPAATVAPTQAEAFWLAYGKSHPNEALFGKFPFDHLDLDTKTALEAGAEAVAAPLRREHDQLAADFSRLAGVIGELLEQTGLDESERAAYLDRAGIHPAGAGSED